MQCMGIYTLANDAVYDQLVALLNSIEANVSPDIPVCVIPYDTQLNRVQEELNARPNVSLFDNWDSIQRWEAFAHQIWAAHPRAGQQYVKRPRWYGGHLQRKFAAFDGYFDKFVFYDADSLAMKSLDSVFNKLDQYDFVFDDWEHRKPTDVAALNISVVEASGCYSEAEIRPKLHCGSFFASKRGFFDANTIERLKKLLIEQNEIKWINGDDWWGEVNLFNYMTLRCDYSLFNFTLSDNPQERTGNCAGADSFVNIDHILYNKQGLKPIHRIHYMNYSSQDFARLSQGQDVKIPYKNEFLHYRFYQDPQQKPKTLHPPNWLYEQTSKFKEFVKTVKVKFYRLFQKQY